MTHGYDENRLRVMVVDDDVPILQVVDDILSTEGFEVRAVPDSRSAVANARDFRPDVALIDLSMPGMDGVEVARAMRADPALANVPIVMMSSHPDVRTRAKEAQVAVVLRKPFSVTGLLRVVRGEGTS